MCTRVFTNRHRPLTEGGVTYLICPEQKWDGIKIPQLWVRGSDICYKNRHLSHQIHSSVLQ